MGFLDAMDISASALAAQRVRMDVISQNIANVDTTETAAGGPYRRKVTVLAEKPADSFSSALNGAMSASAGKGVYVAAIAEDMSDFNYQYDPTNPDANAQGYVAYPNVDETTELTDMMSAARSYEANVTAIGVTKEMALKALEIGK